MAKQTVIGSGVGVDTPNSGRIKWNENFDELYAGSRQTLIYIGSAYPAKTATYADYQGPVQPTMVGVDYVGTKHHE